MTDDIIAKLKQGIAIANADMPMESTPNERRRYALLIAAAILVSGHWPYVMTTDLINTAEDLLAEIERRETADKPVIP